MNSGRSTCWSLYLVLRCETSRVSAPCVLIPRVGKPDVQKVVVYRGGEAVISDCFFALECTTETDADEVRRLLADRWTELAAAYSGACAPYLTKQKLRVLLADIGVGVCHG